MTILTKEQVAMFENAIKNHDDVDIQEFCKIVEEKIKEGMIEIIEEEMKDWVCASTNK